MPAPTPDAADAAAPIPVLIADDDPAIRRTQRAVLTAQEEFTLVGEARDGREAVSLHRELRPAITLMDLDMPVMTGVEAIAAITAETPGTCLVAFTTFDAREWIVAALRAGAAGYFVKDIAPRHLLAGMGAALRGELPLSASVRRALVEELRADSPPHAPLQAPADQHGVTARERELLLLLAEGLTNQQIARRMHLSEGSVKQYLNRVGGKLQVTSRTQILIRSIQLGIIDPSDLPDIR